MAPSVNDLVTPALLIHTPTFEANLAAMDAVLPGSQLRPHVKATKSTALARHLAAQGHPAFCGATPKEIEGLVAAGLTDDLLLANETLDTARLGTLSDRANICVAVDSEATIDAAIAGGVRSVLIDVNVGLPRCGCDPGDAARLAEEARAAGLEVRGVMGYEGHLMMVGDRAKRAEQVAASMALLTAAADAVGSDAVGTDRTASDGTSGPVISGGGTGTFDLNTYCTEIQAGSYALMDTDYDQLDLPFEKALSVLSTVISVNAQGGIVADAGLKAFGMDHGNPRWDDGDVLFCSDEHITLLPAQPTEWRVGDKLRLWPAHVDPTVARYERYQLVDGDEVLDTWEIDLRHW